MRDLPAVRVMPPEDRAAIVIGALGQTIDRWLPLPDVAEVVARIAGTDYEVAEGAVTCWAYCTGLDVRRSVDQNLRTLLLIRYPSNERTTP